MELPLIPTDQDWLRILSPERLADTQRKAEAKYGQATSDQLQYLRNRAKNDLFFLTYSILQYKKLTVNLHSHLCLWMEETRGDQFRLILMPRGHYKTTICTIADSIQCALPGGEGLPYPYNLGPEVRLCLVHETGGGASRFLFETTGHFTGNVNLVGLFPELIPNSRVQRMNKEMLELPREGVWAEPTFDTMAVGAKGQGRHYDKLKLDDIFGDKARDSKAERETTIQWFDNIQSFFIELASTQMDMPGTRYSLDDVYSHAMKVYGTDMKRYIRRIEEPGADGVKRPIFPERFPQEKLKILRKNKKVWSAQYVNDPHEGLAAFEPGWKRYYEWIGQNKVVAMTGTASFVYHIRDLDTIILVDPGVSGTPGIVVTGTSPKLQVFILEVVKVAMRPPDLVEMMFKLVQKWWPRLVGMESVIFSEVYIHWLMREMNTRGTRFNIEPLKPPRNKTKQERVMGLSNYFSAGQIFGHSSQEAFWEEYDNFGATDDYHVLDALAYGPGLWRGGLSRKEMESNAKYEEEMFNDRDAVTGYSR